MKLSIIIVNYKSKQLLHNCLTSIEKNIDSSLDFEVIVVNNDADKLFLEKKYSFDNRVIQSKENLGFGKANNLGAKYAKGENFLLLNPDTLLKDTSIQKMLSFLMENHHIGVVGPKIIQSNRHSPQPFTCGKKTSLLSILFRNTILKPWNKKVPTLVDWVSGTALLIREPIFKKLNGFDERFFMYFEDQDLCLRVKKLGYDISFFPDSYIIHFDGKSWPNTKKQKAAFYKAQDYFFQKHQPLYQGAILKVLKKLAV